MIVYLHGFNSSPASVKSRQLRARLAALGRESEYRCPALPHWPREAIALVEAEVRGQDPSRVTLVGSSLGGFYATWLTERLGVRSVLVNPAIRPDEGLRAYLGPQQNLYTGEPYELTEEHLRQLAALRVERPSRPANYLLIHTTGDELLDWRVAVDHFAGSRRIIVHGHDHGFAGFERYVDVAIAFADGR